VADLTARAVGQKLSEQLGQAFVIDNRPGAGGVTAGQSVAQADPDGYTLLLMSNGTAVSEGLFQKLPFSAQKDFAPVSLLGTFDIAGGGAGELALQDAGRPAGGSQGKPGQLNIATIAVAARRTSRPNCSSPRPGSRPRSCPSTARRRW
jgi:hypothetical protein